MIYIRNIFKWGTKIELLINPKDADYDELQQILYEYLAAADAMDKFDINKPFFDVSQRILKREWEKTKLDLALLRSHWDVPSEASKRRSTALNEIVRKLNQSR